MKLLLITITILFLTSCSDGLTLKKSSFDKINGWNMDNHQEALSSFLKSCERFNTLPKNKPSHQSGIAGTYGTWQEICAKATSYDNAKEFFEDNFRPHLARSKRDPKGTFTGYYEIELKGSRTKHGEYQYPIYKRPSDLSDGQKYYSRKEITEGALEGSNYELAWVSDPVRSFFLHIQGSGRITLDDGSVLRVGYHGQNNHKYFAIGRLMIDEGYIKKEDMSAQAIEAWLHKNPDKTDSILNQNPSYVFFREIKGEGPIGGQGVPLTPERSLAIDKKYIPYGVPIWVDVALSGDTTGKNFRKLMVAQDTGGAIRGPVRGDIFFGYGQEAEYLAGHQNSIGQYFLLLPKNL
jgi:membrane-bound lytic murein transglycosylase A